MAVFSERELNFLKDGSRLARLATVGADGTPHVVPVGMWSYDEETGSILIGGHDLERSKKYRDIRRTGRVAVVIDELASRDPFRPRGIEIRGAGEAILQPQPAIRIHPERVISWGIESDVVGERRSRSV